MTLKNAEYSRVTSIGALLLLNIKLEAYICQLIK